MMKHKKIGAVCILLISLFLAACNSSSSGDGDVELTWLVTTSSVRDGWYTQMIEEFEAENEHITIELVTIPQDEMDQRLSTMLAGGNAPDVWSPNWSRSGFGTYQQRDALLDLTGYIEQDIDFLEGIPQELMELYSVDGRSYGIPMLNMGTYLFYNKDIFDEAGVDYPTTDWEDTNWEWNSLVEKAISLTENIDNPNEPFMGFIIPKRRIGFHGCLVAIILQRKLSNRSNGGTPGGSQS